MSRNKFILHSLSLHQTVTILKGNITNYLTISQSLSPSTILYSAADMEWKPVVSYGQTKIQPTTSEKMHQNFSEAW